MQAYKIDVRNLTEQQKKDVQNAFFEMGYKWRSREVTHQELDRPFYFAEAGTIMYCEGADFFFNDQDCEDNKQITYTELMQLVNKGEDNMSNNFTKANLKDGMVVKLRGGCVYSEFSGRFYLVLGTKYVNQQSHLYGRYYSEDLKNKYCSSGEFDIVEVFEIEAAYSLDFEHMELKSIWRRSEQTEQQKQLSELKAAQDQLMLQAKDITDKIAALQQS